MRRYEGVGCTILLGVRFRAVKMLQWNHLVPGVLVRPTSDLAGTGAAHYPILALVATHNCRMDWLPVKASNLDCMVQNHMSYH